MGVVGEVGVVRWVRVYLCGLGITERRKRGGKDGEGDEGRDASRTLESVVGRGFYLLEALAMKKQSLLC